MPLICLPSSAVRKRLVRACAAAAALALLGGAGAATRPRYGGTLRIELRETVASPEPPAPGSEAEGASRRLAELRTAFRALRWEPGRRAAFAAAEDAPGGRPFLDAVEIEMGRPLREQALALDLGKADLVEAAPPDARRPRRALASSPVRLLALHFGARVQDANVREAFALAIDRAAIQAVLLQRQGEISGALLPQWLSGCAFLFSPTRDLERARALLAAVPSAQRALTLAAPPGDPQARGIVERIALNARDAGLAAAVVSLQAAADVKLVEARIDSTDPARALVSLAAQLGLAEPPAGSTPEAWFAAERALLEGRRIIPLLHLPEVWNASPRLHWWGVPGIGGLGQWRLENAWLEARP